MVEVSDDVGPNCLQCMVGSLDRIFDDIIMRMGKTNRFCMRLLTPIMVAALIWLRHLVEVIWPSPSRNTFSQHLAVVAYREKGGTRWVCASLGVNCLWVWSGLRSLRYNLLTWIIVYSDDGFYMAISDDDFYKTC